MTGGGMLHVHRESHLLASGEPNVWLLLMPMFDAKQTMNQMPLGKLYSAAIYKPLEASHDTCEQRYTVHQV